MPRAVAAKRPRAASAGKAARAPSRAPPQAAAGRRARALDEEIALGGAGDDSDLDDDGDEGAGVPVGGAGAGAAATAEREEAETADDKKLRLARQYLGTLADAMGGGDDAAAIGSGAYEEADEARGVLRPRAPPRPTPAALLPGGILHDAVAARLRDDALLVSGALFRPVAALLRNKALGAELVTFASGHSQPVTCVALSADGRTAVTGSKDCTLLRWRIGVAAAATAVGSKGRARPSSSRGSGSSSSGGLLSLEQSGVCPGRRRTKADVQQQAAAASRGIGDRGLIPVLGSAYGGGRLGPLGLIAASVSGGAGAGGHRIIHSADGVSTIIGHVPQPKRRVGGVGGGEGVGTGGGTEGGDTATAAATAARARSLLRSVPDFGIGGHWGEVLTVALSSDGAYIASGGRDKAVRVWEGGDGETATAVGAGGGGDGAALPVLGNVDNFVGHKDAVSALSFRPGTRTLFSGGLDRLVKIWSLDEMAHVETLFGHQADITGLDVPPGGLLGGASALSGGGGGGGGGSTSSKERCFTCGRDRTARLWKVSEQTQLVFRGLTSSQSLECISALTDTLAVTGASDGSISLWSASRKKPIFTVQCAHGSGVDVPTASVHAPPAAVAAAERASAAAEGREEGRGDGIGGLAPPGSVRLLSGDADGLCAPPPELLADISRVTGCVPTRLSSGYCAGVTALALMPHSDVLASGSGDGFIRLWRLVAGGGTRGGGEEGEGGGGGGGGGGTVSFRALEHIAAIPLPGIVNGLAFSRDGSLLAAAVGTEHRLGRWWAYGTDAGARNGLAVIALGGVLSKAA